MLVRSTTAILTSIGTIVGIVVAALAIAARDQTNLTSVKGQLILALVLGLIGALAALLGLVPATVGRIEADVLDLTMEDLADGSTVLLEDIALAVVEQYRLRERSNTWLSRAVAVGLGCEVAMVTLLGWAGLVIVTAL